jgi:hypothetical protein
MNTLAQLTGAHRRTYQKILHQPDHTDVQRKAVRALLETLGRVTDIGTDKLEVTRNGHILVILSIGNHQTESPEELLALRHFLERSEFPLHPTNGREAHMLLVIGHRSARLYRAEVYGGFPEQIHPHGNPEGFLLADSSQQGTGLDTKTPGMSSCYEPIAQALCATGKILIFGESNATEMGMDRFIEWLKQQHPDLAARIIGSMVLAEDQADSGLLLAKAQEFYAHARAM